MDWSAGRIAARTSQNWSCTFRLTTPSTSSAAIVYGPGGISATRLKVCPAAPITASAGRGPATKSCGSREVQANAETPCATACSVRCGGYAGGRSLDAGGGLTTVCGDGFISAPCPTADGATGLRGGGTITAVSRADAVEISALSGGGRTIAASAIISSLTSLSGILATASCARTREAPVATGISLRSLIRRLAATAYSQGLGCCYGFSLERG